MIDIRQDEISGEIIIIPPSHLSEEEGREYVKKVIKEMQEMNLKSKKRDKWMLIVMFIALVIMGVASEARGDELARKTAPVSNEIYKDIKKRIDRIIEKRDKFCGEFEEYEQVNTDLLYFRYPPFVYEYEGLTLPTLQQMEELVENCEIKSKK